MLNNQKTPILASRIKGLKPSPIREILKVIAQPGMVSFAGGLPAADSFPQIHLDQVPADCLQYGASEGEENLRALLATRLQKLGLDAEPDRLLILSGSQQGIDLVAKLFIDPGTAVAVESPTYLAALQVFDLFGAKTLPFNPDHPERMLDHPDKPAVCYVIPTFQNPSGHCYTSAQRDALADLCDAERVPLFEDDPYRELAYDPCERAPICARLKNSSWIYQSSFSKTLAPGLRLGYLAASEDLFPYLSQLKQAADLHSNRLSQHVVYKLISEQNDDDRYGQLASHYKAKRDAFDQLLREHFSAIAEWDVPKGGLFFWLKLKTHEPLDTRSLLTEAIHRQVAFMPGEPFFPEATDAASSFRLNFSHASLTDAERGLRTLAEIFTERLQ